MTTIFDLVRQVTFDDVWGELKKNSPNIDEYRESFEKIFCELSSQSQDRIGVHLYEKNEA